MSTNVAPIAAPMTNNIANTTANIKTGLIKFLGMADIFIVNVILLGITVLIILIILYYIGLYSILSQKIKNLNEILLYSNEKPNTNTNLK
jgi:hypothetical protein